MGVFVSWSIWKGNGFCRFSTLFLLVPCWHLASVKWFSWVLLLSMVSALSLVNCLSVLNICPTHLVKGGEDFSRVSLCSS